jgi:transcriptional regulator with XRE-family HTH domain
MKIGPILQLVRRRAGLDGRDLAQMVGVNATYLSRMENDRIPIKLDNLEAVCRALNIPMWKVIRAAEQYEDRVLPEIESLFEKTAT